MITTTTGLDINAFDTNGRARRPPPDPVNALLSFVYALLVKDLTVTLTLVGLDPFIGVYHRPRYGRPALALDLAEEFRPQYSVFICDLSRTELVHARTQVERQMNLAEDSVVIVDLGDTDSARFTFIGRRRPLPTSEPRIL